MTNKERALACVARGWLVFPSRAKRPLVAWGTKATTDPSMITEWWDDAFPDADVCIKTGAESNLVVVDWDVYKQDTTAWPLGPTFPHTYTTATPKDGRHFYFTHPGYPVWNTAGQVAPFVDVRGDGGMVVAYDCVVDLPVAPFPEEFAVRREHKMREAIPPAAPYAGEDDGLQLAVDLLELYAKDVLAAAEGTLNNTLYQRAADAYKMVAAGELKAETVHHLMLTVAVAAGHPREGALRTISSALSKGYSEPTSCVDLYLRRQGHD